MQLRRLKSKLCEKDDLRIFFPNVISMLYCEEGSFESENYQE